MPRPVQMMTREALEEEVTQSRATIKVLRHQVHDLTPCVRCGSRQAARSVKAGAMRCLDVDACTNRVNLRACANESIFP